MAGFWLFLCGTGILFMNFGGGLGNWGPRFDKFQQDILGEHNRLRARHGAPPLNLDAELCRGAKQEAERKAQEYARLGQFGKNGDNDVDDRNYNDNVWASVSYAATSLKASKVLEEWIKQARRHDFNTNYFDPNTGHFTQMVWKSTEDIGVGFAKARTPKKHHVTVVVIRYSPPGNILDEDTFKENVLPPGSSYKK